MIYVSGSRTFTMSLCGFVVYLALAGVPMTGGLTQTADAQLDQIIPREKWEGTGLNKLTVPEQQTLANEITVLLGARRPAENAAPTRIDKNQWRKLQRRMPKDDVRKLLGEPDRISVSRFFEVWDYAGGSVTFDGKGHVDSWTEPQTRGQITRRWRADSYIKELLLELKWRSANSFPLQIDTNLHAIGNLDKWNATIHPKFFTIYLHCGVQLTGSGTVVAGRLMQLGRISRGWGDKPSD